MDISRKSLETLIDLVEIKLSCIEVHDRDDKRVRDSLQTCLDELRGINGTPEAAVALNGSGMNGGAQRGRPPAAWR